MCGPVRKSCKNYSQTRSHRLAAPRYAARRGGGGAYLRPLEAAVAGARWRIAPTSTVSPPREFSEFYGTPYRWSKPLVYISLHGLGSRGRFRLELETYGGPEELHGRKVEVLVNGVPAGSFQTGVPIGIRRPSSSAPAGGRCRVELRVPEGHAHGDSRALGILLRSFRVRQTSAALPALSQVAAGMLLAAFVYLLAVLLGLKRIVCWAAAALAGLALSFGLLEARLALAAWSYGLVFSALGAGALIAGGGLLMRARPLSRVNWGGRRAPRLRTLRWPSPSCSGWVGLPIPRHT